MLEFTNLVKDSRMLELTNLVKDSRMLEFTNLVKDSRHAGVYKLSEGVKACWS